jgi:hypothetical protein
LDKFSKTYGHNDALILIAETVGHVVDRAIFKYHLCDNWSMGYWKSHVDMYACLAIAYQRHVFPVGKKVTAQWLEAHVDGLSLFQYRDSWGIDIPAEGRWWPDQVVDDPELFLEGIDNEDRISGRGREWAVERWLAYCRIEMLDIYGSDYGPKVIQSFEQWLVENRNKSEKRSFFSAV